MYCLHSHGGVTGLVDSLVHAKTLAAAANTSGMNGIPSSYPFLSNSCGSCPCCELQPSRPCRTSAARMIRNNFRFCFPPTDLKDLHCGVTAATAVHSILPLKVIGASMA